MSCPPLVLCERYSTKMTAAACAKFKANTPERCKGCAGPLAEASLDSPVVLATPVHIKPKSAPLVVNYAKRNAQVRAKKEKDNVATTSTTGKKVTECGKCKETKPIMSRGLCGKCWHQENNAGTLDANFPSAYKKGSAPKPEAQEPSSFYALAKDYEGVEYGPAIKTKNVHKQDLCKSCCKKEQMSSRGLCTDCYTIETRRGTLDDNYPSPHGTMTKQDVSGFVRGVSISEQASKEIQNSGATVTLFFRDDDQDLLEFLSAEARKSRRSIDQEILFRLDRSLPADASGAVS